MRRGDVVTVAVPGDYGKPRPAVVIQTGAINSAEPAFAIGLALDLGPPGDDLGVRPDAFETTNGRTPGRLRPPLNLGQP